MHYDVEIPLLCSSAVEKMFSNLLLGRIVIWSALLFLNFLVLQQGMSFSSQELCAVQERTP